MPVLPRLNGSVSKNMKIQPPSVLVWDAIDDMWYDPVMDVKYSPADMGIDEDILDS
ncbi:MAG: hypothetical protein M1129_04065 [Candidatus Thermoplasmatota archaeon]|nr:hypothetical protein [Candidatus Thermoplasmatota archaeon]MCL5955034.1 hypothetical protein [Candidatus Thermoplasmatota archaeon]